MKKLFCLLLLTYLFFLAQFCFSQEKKSSCAPILLTENNIQVQLNIDALQQTMILNFSDDAAIYETIYKRNEKIKKSLNCALFHDQNFLFTIVANPDHCAPQISGIIGSDLLQRNGELYFLNFDEMQICSLTSADFKSWGNRKEYQEWKSIFSRDKIEIFVSINWQDYKFTFDICYEGTFSHVNNNNLIGSRDHSIIYSAISNKPMLRSHEIKIFPFTKIYINKVGYSGALRLDDEKDNRVGLGFIKGFNWIVDYKKKKIYYKKNNSALDSNIVQSQYKSKIMDDEIIVVEVKQNCRKYKVGDKITTVSGIEVNSENICKIQKLIDNSVNWDELLLVIK